MDLGRTLGLTLSDSEKQGEASKESHDLPVPLKAHSDLEQAVSRQGQTQGDWLGSY